MFAQTSEFSMRIVRFSLLASWCGLLVLCVIDIGQTQLTNPSHPLSIEGLTAKTIELRGEVLEAQAYNPATRFFWGVGIPIVVLTLIIFGHDTWRRICPMSAVSQIPRWLGFQIKTGKGKSRRVAMINPTGFLARNAILIQFFLFATVVTLRLTLLSANPFALFIFTILIFVLAFATGLFFSGKTWCHYFCPMNSVQLTINGPRGLNSAKPNTDGLSQSMCRKPGPENVDVSICVGCNSPCPDVDIERNYWDRLPTLQRRLAVYGYFGAVIGFIHGLFAATGDFSYGAAVWYDSHWNAVGYYPYGENLPIPRWLGSGVTMLTWILASWAVGLFTEKALVRIHRKNNKNPIALEVSRHQTQLIFSFSALLLLIYGVALPGMAWLPQFVVWLIGIASTASLSMWLYRSWYRTHRAYQRESLAESIRKQLLRMNQNWAEYLNGRDLKDLSTDEVHLISELTPNLESHNRAAFYEAFLNDAITQGSIDTLEGRKVLENLRKSCNISIDEHKKIVDRLKGDYELNDSLLISTNLRLTSFKSELEKIILTEISSGRSLEKAITNNAEKIESLRQNYSLTPEEEDRAIKEIGSNKGTVGRLIEDLTEQLHQLADYGRSLTTSYADNFLKQSLKHQSTEILEQIIMLLETLEHKEYFSQLIRAVVNADHTMVREFNFNTKNDAIKSTFHQILNQMIPTTLAIDGNQHERTLKALAKMNDQYIALVATRSAHMSGYTWAEQLLASKRRLISNADFSSNNQSKNKIIVSLTPYEKHTLFVKNSLTAGRAEDNDWIVKIPEASRHHFRLFIENNKVLIEDLNSANGTIINEDVIRGKTIEITYDATIRLAHDTNPASLSIRNVPTEDVNNPIDRFALLSASTKFNALSYEKLFKTRDMWKRDEP